MTKTARAKLAPKPLTEALARKAGDAALAKAAELGTTMSVAVVDESGQLIYFVRGDGTGFHTLESTRGKAATAAAMPRIRPQLRGIAPPPRRLAAKVSASTTSLRYCTPELFPLNLTLQRKSKSLTSPSQIRNVFPFVGFSGVV